MGQLRKTQRKKQRNNIKELRQQEKANKAYAESCKAQQDFAREVLDIAMPLIVKDITQKLQSTTRQQEIGKLLMYMTMTLHDEFGFGKKRLEQFTRRFVDIIDTVEDDTVNKDVSIYTINSALINETGFNVEACYKEHEKVIAEHRKAGTYVARKIYERAV